MQSQMDGLVTSNDAMRQELIALRQRVSFCAVFSSEAETEPVPLLARHSGRRPGWHRSIGILGLGSNACTQRVNSADFLHTSTDPR